MGGHGETPRSEIPGIVQADVRAEEEAAGRAQVDSNPAADPVGDQTSGDGLDSLTKDELLQEAENRGVEVKTSASKADILAALRG
jgi:diphthamide biosynthesis methyltransferase